MQTADGELELLLGQRVLVSTAAYDAKRDRFALTLGSYKPRGEARS